HCGRSATLCLSYSSCRNAWRDLKTDWPLSQRRCSRSLSYSPARNLSTSPTPARARATSRAWSSSPRRSPFSRTRLWTSPQSVSPMSASVTVGQTVQLAATTTDAAGNVLSGRAVAWTSSDLGVATVSSSGLVSALAVGSATLAATSEGHGATVALTVSSVPVASVVVSPASSSAQVGASVQFTAVPKDLAGNALTGRAVSWVSSNGSVVT